MARVVSRPAVGAVALLAVAGCGSSAAPRPTAVTAAGIRSVFAATHEVDYPDEKFALLGSPAVTPDGHGGTFTAAIGERNPTADGKGMIVGFWHDATFVGFGQDYEVLAISDVRVAGSGGFTVRYVNYRDTDPLCCPSGKPPLLPIDYHWNGKAFVTMKPLPDNLYRAPAEVIVPPH